MTSRLLALSCCISLLLAGCAFLATDDGAQPTNTGETDGRGIEFTIDVSGTDPTFRPALQFTGSEPATVTIDWGDGAAPLEQTVTAASWMAPAHDYATSDSTRKATLSVEPWAVLTVVNVGFRAGDGGNDASRTNTGVTIDFLPPAEGDFGNPYETLDAASIRGYVGTVTAVSGLQNASNLRAFCCEQQPIETLDVSGMSSLRTVEAFFSGVKTTNFRGCEELRRCCLESTGANASWSMEGGERIESEELDLRDSPFLQDIRGTGDDHVRVRLHPDARSTLWHLCKMGNYRMDDIAFGNGAPIPFNLSEFSALAQCWVSGSPILPTALAIDNGATESVWASGMGITSVNASNQAQLTDLELSGNPLAELEIAGCESLERLDLRDCALTQALVDGILETLDGFGTYRDYSQWMDAVDMANPEFARIVLASGEGSERPNAAPSAAGAAHVTALRSRGWSIAVNQE